MLIQPRVPGQGTSYPPDVPPAGETTAWTNSPTTSWTTKTTIATITEIPCSCTTTIPPPLVIVTTTSTPAAAVPAHSHASDDHGLAPGVIGGIVIGAFFGFLLLVLLCIFCTRAYRRGRGYYSDDESPPPRKRRTVILPHDPYPNRPDANLTFVGGGNKKETRVVITKTQRYFIRPSTRPAEARSVRTTRRETKRERIVIVGD